MDTQAATSPEVTLSGVLLRADQREGTTAIHVSSTIPGVPLVRFSADGMAASNVLLCVHHGDECPIAGWDWSGSAGLPVALEEQL